MIFPAVTSGFSRRKQAEKLCVAAAGGFILATSMTFTGLIHHSDSLHVASLLPLEPAAASTQADARPTFVLYLVGSKDQAEALDLILAKDPTGHSKRAVALGTLEDEAHFAESKRELDQMGADYRVLDLRFR